MTFNIVLTEDRYERLEEIPWWNQKALRDACLLVAGVGALGNEILKNAALLGIGRLIIVDYDVVELSNLTRSVLFRKENRAEPKVTAAAAQIQQINPDVRVFALAGNLRWDVGLGVYRRMNAILGGLDSMGARVALNRMCWQVGVPWIDGGINELNGIMRVYMPPDGACYECSLSRADYAQLNQRFSCQLLPQQLEEGHTPTSPTIASLVAAWQVQEAVKLLHGLPIAASKGISYNGLTHAFFMVNYARRDSCSGHAALPEVIELPEASCTQTVNEFRALLDDHFGVPVQVILDHEIVYRLSCAVCGTHEHVLLPHYALDADTSRCPTCHRERVLHMTHYLDQQRVMLDGVPLSALGIPPLHILAAKLPGGALHYVELSGDLHRNPVGRFIRGEATS